MGPIRTVQADMVTGGEQRGTSFGIYSLPHTFENQPPVDA